MGDQIESGEQESSAAVKIQTLAGRFDFTNKAIPKYVDFSRAELDERSQWITDAIKDGASEFQKFLLHYFGRGVYWERSAVIQKLVRLGLGRSVQWERSLNRFALCVGLVTKYCPPGGRWFDAGALGHDAIRVKLERPDIDINLASYEGCILYLDVTGLHYSPGGKQPPEPYVWCKQCDLESQKADLADASVDLVTSFEALEHYKFAPQHFMLEVNRILKPGGRLILTTPNGLSAAAISRILHGQHPAENAYYSRIPEYGRIHPLEYTGEQLRDLVAAHGFDISLLASMNMAPFDRGELEAISAARCASSMLRGKHPGEFGEKWLLIATKVKHVSEPQYPGTLFE